jgi:predicted RNase H-like HicB family nuclease
MMERVRRPAFAPSRASFEIVGGSCVSKGTISTGCYARCAAVGDTQKETRANFKDALDAHFEAMREIGERIPEPTSAVDYVELAA